MIWFRNTAYVLALLLALPWLAYRGIRTRRYREGWGQKLFGFVPHLDSSQPTIWLHGVSVGEIQLLKPLADRLATQYPDHRIVVSTTTSTGMDLATRLFPNHRVFYLPLDFSWSVRRALRRIAPSIIVLGELELWPNLIEIAGNYGIPIAVVNGRLSDTSFRRYLRFATWLRPMFQQLHLVAAQTDSYAERFRILGASSVVVTGSTKYDNVCFDRLAPPIHRLATLVGLQAHHRIIVAGSTQDPEEQFTCQAFAILQQQYPDLRLIVVPRHQERFNTVYELLVRQGIQAVRRSDILKPISAQEWRVLVVDTIGELRWWWGLAEIALVGGSFGERGGQNMIEPAAFGANVAFGPNTWNFRDIVLSLRVRDSVVVLPSLQELLPWLEAQLNDPEPGRLRGERARQVILDSQGATQRTVELLGAILSPSDGGRAIISGQQKSAAA